MQQGDWKFSLAQLREHLSADPGAWRASYGLRHGSMRVGLYAPESVDEQGPHKQDELYIVISGCGDFIKNGERYRFAPQDVLFVEAGSVHRFENFTDDFSTWVIFWGPEGGERSLGMPSS